MKVSFEMKIGNNGMKPFQPFTTRKKLILLKLLVFNPKDFSRPSASCHLLAGGVLGSDEKMDLRLEAWGGSEAGPD